MASENTSRKRRQGGKGRPFPPGQTPAGASPWKPGQSGNPAGRPKAAPEFRARCRQLAERLLDVSEAVLAAGFVPREEHLRALEVFADRGGYLAADKLALAEAARGRLVLEAVSLKTITAEQRQGLLQSWFAHEREALGEPAPAGQPPNGDRALPPKGDGGVRDP